MRDLHASQIKAAVEAVKARKEVNEVYFVACGGSQAVLMAGQYMFDKESSIPSHRIRPRTSSYMIRRSVSMRTPS